MLKKESIKGEIVRIVVYLFLFIIIYMIGSKIYYGKVYFLNGNNHKDIFEMNDLKKVSKDFIIQEDQSFMSISPDPWFNIEENFYVKTILIDIDETSEIHDSQIFYYSDELVLDESRSYYFKLKRGMNYIQIPDGKYNMFRLDLANDTGAILKIDNIAVYGYRIIPVTFLFLLVTVWIFCSYVVCKILCLCKLSVKSVNWREGKGKQCIYEVYQNMKIILQAKWDIVTNFCQIFTFFLIEFGIMLNRHYSLDSFTYSNSSAIKYKGHLLTARVGAYVAAFLFKDIDITKHQIWFAGLLILTITFSAAIIYNHYIQWTSDDKRKRFLLKMAIAVMYGNVYMIDFFHFPEALPPMIFGILFMTLAVRQILPDMSVKNFLKMTVFMIISLNCYQVTLGFFTFFALTNVFLINKGILTKKAFINSFKIVILGDFTAGATNVILLRVLQKTGVVAPIGRTEVVGVEGWISNATQIVREAYYLFKDVGNFLPPRSIFIMVLLLYTLVIVTLWNMKASWGSCLYIFLMVLICRGMVFAPHLLASEVWLAPRSIISYWSIISIPCVVLVVLANRDTIKNMALVFMFAFCLINVLSIQRIGINMISRNRIDEEISYLIQSKIVDYENTSGMKINTISFRNDMNPSWYYRSSDFGAYELGQRGYTAAWSCSVDMINYFNEENYSHIKMDDETFRNYFDKENWDYLDLDEQLTFDGNVAYFVAY